MSDANDRLKMYKEERELYDEPDDSGPGNMFAPERSEKYKKWKEIIKKLENREKES